jgi:hypothetical protein
MLSKIKDALFRARLSKLKLTPEDILVVKTDPPFDYMEVSLFKSKLAKYGFDNCLIFLGSKDDISTLDEAAMKKAGWVKA